MWYVYELIDPRDNSVFYVGKGKGDRMHLHEKNAKRDRRSAKSLRIMDINGEGYSVIKRKTAEFDNEEEAYLEEIERIAEIGLANLTNVLPGGGGVRDPQVAVDRNMVRCAAIVWKASVLKKSKTMRLCGQYFDITPLLDAYIKRIDEIAKNRTMRWVNFIARQEGVQF